MKNLLIGLTILASMSSFASELRPYDGLKGAAIATTGTVVGGKVGWTLYLASAGPTLLGASLLVGSSAAVGYGSGMVIRDIDSRLGSYLHKTVYFIGDNTKIFDGIMTLENAVKRGFRVLTVETEEGEVKQIAISDEESDVE